MGARKGSFNLILNLISSFQFDCLFWPTGLSIDQNQCLIDVDKFSIFSPFSIKSTPSIELLTQYCNFSNDLSGLFSPFLPRGLNSVTKRSIALKITNTYGAFFKSYSCDYTSAFSLLSSIPSAYISSQPLYLETQKSINGKRTAIYGWFDRCPVRFMKKLQDMNIPIIDTVYLSVLDDLLSIPNLQPSLLKSLQENLLGIYKSFAFELLFKIRNGSPLPVYQDLTILDNHARLYLSPIDLESYSLYRKEFFPKYVFYIFRLLRKFSLLDVLRSFRLSIINAKRKKNILFRGSS